MLAAESLRRLAALVLSFCVLASGGTARAESPFAHWAAIVVAGDWHAHSGGPSEAFDNARRDVSKELVRIGFAPDNLRQFSVRPERYKDTTPGKTEPKGIYDALVALTANYRWVMRSSGMHQRIQGTFTRLVQASHARRRRWEADMDQWRREQAQLLDLWYCSKHDVLLWPNLQSGGWVVFPE